MGGSSQGHSTELAPEREGGGGWRALRAAWLALGGGAVAGQGREARAESRVAAAPPPAAGHTSQLRIKKKLK